ncbi:hypothetical lipoprotein [Campylobacter iguaniorum]|uniref:Hypothetical lipoprotein n=1 Tax=Campylobacter iguaniorum TaxID=1244531 RepID=A0A076FBS7_9BACT|nr:hypothetical protein [Campylobacter iguaniorum]AII15391.1 hypothetical lipoprotein [Campylobacter iguaniorum]
MIKFIRFFSLFVAIFLLNACATPQAEHSKSISLLIKSNLIKINDTGFVHFYKNGINLQVYNSGKNILNLNIKDQICINGACQSKLDFNQKLFLSSHYPELLEDIISQKPIFQGIEMQKTSCGFEQSIRKLLVEYKVCDGLTSFIDKKNGTKIIMKELN